MGRVRYWQDRQGVLVSGYATNRKGSAGRNGLSWARGAGRMQLFAKAGDFEAFERVLSETLQEALMRIGCHCVMPNPWHLLLWLARVHRADNEKELEALRRSVQRGRPYGATDCQYRIAKRLGLESAYRSSGRPRIARGGIARGEDHLPEP